MMDTELEAEIRPLKQDDGKPPGSLENRIEKDGSFKKASQRSWCAQYRTVFFFFLLFTCLFTVFIISFIIPCPDHVIPEKIWKINYNVTGTYDFMVFKDINQDTIEDIILLYKDKSGSGSFNISCTDGGYSSPCAFFAAVSGANGSLLWEKPVAQDVAYVECATPRKRDGSPSTCFIVEKNYSFLAVDLNLGEIMWNQPWIFGVNASLLHPFLSIPDVTGDAIQDLLFFIKSGKEIKSYLYSSSTGEQVGSMSRLNLEGEVGFFSHVTNAGAYYIIFHSASSLYGYPLKDLIAEMTGGKTIFEEDPYWKITIDEATHKIPPPLSSGTILYIMDVPVDTGTDILLVKSDACELIDGRWLTSKWLLSISEVVRKPVLGYYKPNVPAIVLETGTGVQRKILIVDATSGDILWNHTLPSFARTPKSATIQTAEGRSAFFFWDSSKQMETAYFQKNLYMFYPTIPDILLDLTNITQSIVTFNVLLEESSYASYVLLTGPSSQDSPGVMSLTKQKMKKIIQEAQVMWLGQARPEDEQTIKNRFYDLKFKKNQ